NRLTEPSGVGPSGMREAPAPMLRPPQARFLMTVLETSFVLPQLLPPAVNTKSRVVLGGIVVVVCGGTVVGAAGAMAVLVGAVAPSETRNIPRGDTGRGPARSADASTSPLPVAAMQNTDASVADAGVPFVMAPAATPFSVMVRHAGLPKQPNACPIWSL